MLTITQPTKCTVCMLKDKALINIDVSPFDLQMGNFSSWQSILALSLLTLELQSSSIDFRHVKHTCTLID